MRRAPPPNIAISAAGSGAVGPGYWMLTGAGAVAPMDAQSIGGRTEGTVLTGVWTRISVKREMSNLSAPVGPVAADGANSENASPDRGGFHSPLAELAIKPFRHSGQSAVGRVKIRTPFLLTLVGLRSASLRSQPAATTLDPAPHATDCKERVTLGSGCFIANRAPMLRRRIKSTKLPFYLSGL